MNCRLNMIERKVHGQRVQKSPTYFEDVKHCQSVYTSPAPTNRHVDCRSAKQQQKGLSETYSGKCYHKRTQQRKGRKL